MLYLRTHHSAGKTRTGSENGKEQLLHRWGPQHVFRKVRTTSFYGLSPGLSYDEGRVLPPLGTSDKVTSAVALLASAYAVEPASLVRPAKAVSMNPLPTRGAPGLSGDSATHSAAAGLSSSLFQTAGGFDN